MTNYTQLDMSDFNSTIVFYHNTIAATMGLEPVTDEEYDNITQEIIPLFEEGLSYKKVSSLLDNTGYVLLLYLADYSKKGVEYLIQDGCVNDLDINITKSRKIKLYWKESNAKYYKIQHRYALNTSTLSEKGYYIKAYLYKQ